MELEHDATLSDFAFNFKVCLYNEARFAVEGKLGGKGVVSKAAHVVDLPGHPRLRARQGGHRPHALDLR